MNQGIDDTNDEEVEESKLERDESEKNEVPNKRKRHVPIRHVEHAFGPTDRHLPLDLIRLSISGDRQNKWKCTACNTVFPLSKLAPHLSGLRKCRLRNTTAFYCPVRGEVGIKVESVQFKERLSAPHVAPLPKDQILETTRRSGPHGASL